MPNEKYRLTGYLLHAIIWLTIFLWKLSINYSQNPNHFMFWGTFLLFLEYVFAFYIFALYLLPRFLIPRKYIQFFCGVVVFLLVYLSIDYFFEMVVEKVLYGVRYNISILKFALIVSHYYFLFGFIGALYYFANRTLINERRLRQAEKSLHEKERLELENAALLAKINPHLLYNTLNAFYSRFVRSGDEDAAEAMLGFSKMMRYTIHQQNNENGLVPLTEELTNIQRLIHIYQFQYNHTLHIQYMQQGGANGRVPAHTLLTLVENALKYGQLQNPTEPVVITVNAETAGQLRFTLHNAKRADNPEKGTGIGVHFVQKRLEQVYQKNFTFTIQNNPTTYSITIILRL